MTGTNGILVQDDEARTEVHALRKTGTNGIFVQEDEARTEDRNGAGINNEASDNNRVLTWSWKRQAFRRRRRQIKDEEIRVPS
jgi:hypothetical protein